APEFSIGFSSCIRPLSCSGERRRLVWLDPSRGHSPDRIRPVPSPVCRNASSVNSITRPRRTRAVTLPGGRGERFGHTLGAGRRRAQQEPDSAGRGLGGVPDDGGPGELIDHSLKVAGAEDEQVTALPVLSAAVMAVAADWSASGDDLAM